MSQKTLQKEEVLVNEMLGSMLKLREEIDSYIESFEVMLDSNTLASLKQAEVEIEEGKVGTWEDLVKAAE